MRPEEIEQWGENDATSTMKSRGADSRWAVRIGRWAAVIVLATPPVRAQVTETRVAFTGFEVTQGVQDWMTTVPLVIGRHTIVRAHLLAPGDEPVIVEEAKLHASHFGAPLPGSPLSPINPGGIVAAQPLARFRGEDADSSANFLLPLEWTTGNVDLRFEAKDVVCRESSGAPNNCAMHSFFTEQARLDLKFINVIWQDERGLEHQATRADIFQEIDKIKALFPVEETSAFSMAMFRWPKPGRPDLLLLTAELEAMRVRDGCGEGCGTIYFGLVKDGEGSLFDDEDRVSSNAGASALPGSSRFGSDEHIVAHRLALVLGVPHPVHSSLTGAAGQKSGWCNERAPASTPDYPSLVQIEGATYPALGPMQDGADYLIYGLAAFQGAPLKWPYTAPTRASLWIVSPFRTADLMSHCGYQDTRLDRFTWPSKFTYEALLRAIQARMKLSSSPAAAAQGMLLVTGWVDPHQPTAQLYPLARVKGVFPLPSRGAYELQLRLTTGDVTYAFQPLGLTEHNGETKAAVPFVLAVPEPANLTEVTVRLGDAVLARRSASLNPPVVRVLFPNGGESLETSPVVIRWEGSDTDGDGPLYDVQFSPDEGDTWETLGLRLTGTEYTIDPANLKSSSAGLIRVTASDGFHTASDLSDRGFTVANRLPSVTIRAPEPERVLAGSEAAVFVARVNRFESELIPREKILWRSDRDGLLGTGSVLQKPAPGLSVGTHRISVTAQDESGSVGTASTTISVARDLPPNLADLELAVAEKPSPDPTGRSRYTIYVVNHGPSSATNLHLVSAFSPQLTWVSTDGTSAPCALTGAQVECALGDLEAGEHSALTYTVLGSGDVEVTVNGGINDPVPGNRAAPQLVSVPSMSVTLTAVLAAGQLRLTWPFLVQGVVLEVADRLEPMTVWNPVTVPTQRLESLNSVSLPLGKASQFFRLVQPGQP